MQAVTPLQSLTLKFVLLFLYKQCILNVFKCLLKQKQTHLGVVIHFEIHRNVQVRVSTSDKMSRN